jgi:RNA polymerase sigma-70 factor (ECF subfamily)
MEPALFQQFLGPAEARWPELRLDRQEFERHVRMLFEREAPPQVQHAADLYLALACATGAKGAVAAFDAVFARTLTAAIARIDGSPDFIDETAHALRIKLFVHDPPKIASYGGRAKLSTWLTTFAARGAMDQRAARGRPVAHANLAERVAATANPEVDFVRARYKAEFEGAVASALARLTPRDRGLLRLHLGERMSIDGLAVAYRVGRSTAARWLASARAQLLEEVEDELRARLRTTPSEIRELGVALRSELDVSVLRLLGSSGEPRRDLA